MIYSKNPPDFSDWILTDEKSYFYDPMRKRYHAEPKSLDDESANNWIGYLRHYRSKDGAALGRELDFFKKGAILRVWYLDGDREEDPVSFAILKNKTWQCFDGKYYTVVVPIPITDKGGRISSIEISAETKDGRRYFAKVEIDR